MAYALIPATCPLSVSQFASTRAKFSMEASSGAMGEALVDVRVRMELEGKGNRKQALYRGPWVRGKDRRTGDPDGCAGEDGVGGKRESQAGIVQGPGGQGEGQTYRRP